MPATATRMMGCQTLQIRCRPLCVGVLCLCAWVCLVFAFASVIQGAGVREDENRACAVCEEIIFTLVIHARVYALLLRICMCMHVQAHVCIHMQVCHREVSRTWPRSPPSQHALQVWPRPRSRSGSNSCAHRTVSGVRRGRVLNITLNCRSWASF